MRTLLVLRHAQSGHDDPRLADHDRPLTERGQRDADWIGRVLKKHGLTPDVVVSSTAQRALDTAQRTAQACGYAAPIETTRRLYDAEVRQIAEVVGEIDDQHGIALIVGHNPGLQEFLVHRAGWHGPLHTAMLAQVVLDGDRWEVMRRRAHGSLKRVWWHKDK